MAVRIRKDGRILCAAMHPLEEGDTYIDDNLHYKLAVELEVLVTEKMFQRPDKGRGGHSRHGEWWWKHEVPDDVYTRPKNIVDAIKKDSTTEKPWDSKQTACESNRLTALTQANQTDSSAN